MKTKNRWNYDVAYTWMVGTLSFLAFGLCGFALIPFLMAIGLVVVFVESYETKQP